MSGAAEKPKNAIDKAVGKVFDNTIGQVAGDKLDFVKHSLQDTLNTPARLYSNISKKGDVIGGIGATVGQNFRRVQQDFIAPAMGAFSDPEGEKEAAKAAADAAAANAPTPEQLAKEEDERKKAAKRQEEQRLLAEYPGRGGVITNSAPTFRFF